MQILQVIENPEYLEKPDDHSNNYHNVQDIFNFTVHGDVPVDKP
jgi:hypothetical protein